MSNKKKIKLREQKDIVSFILAIFNGANINERWNGDAIITHYFEDMRDRHFSFFNPNTFTYCQNQYAKIKTLIYFGADTSEIFQKNNYKKLIFGLSAQISQILLMLSCGSLLNKISGYRRQLLKAFKQELLVAANSVVKIPPFEHTEKRVADISELFGNVVGSDVYYQSNSMDYDSVIMSATNKLILLSILLSGKEAQKEITGWRYEAATGLCQLMTSANQFIESTGLTANMNNAPDFFHLSKEYIEKLNEAASISQFDSEIMEKYKERLYEINDILQEDSELGE